jgi:hypothetical protein
VRYAKTHISIYRDPKARADDYLGPIHKGQPLRLTGKTSKDGMYAEVVALNPDGSEQKARGWVYRALLKAQQVNTGTLSVLDKFNRGVSLPNYGPSTCARSLRTALGVPGWSKYAKDSGAGLIRQGWRQRPGNIIHHGDIVVYAGDWGSYRGDGKGHIGIGEERPDGMYLVSQMSGKWQRTPIGSGIIGVYYQP